MQATKIEPIVRLQEISMGCFAEASQENVAPHKLPDLVWFNEYQARLKAGWAWQEGHADTVTPAAFVRMVLEPQLRPRRINERCGCARCNAREKEANGE